MTIVDITHNVVPYDLLDGALAIGSAYKYFPSKTVHLVIVDPGVGTERRPLLVCGEQQFFVGPDNGVFSLVYEREERISVRHVTAEHYFLNPVSKTFHGRDVFAPVAAWLTKAWQTQSFGEEISEYARFSLPKPKTADGAVKGLILRVDSFQGRGNVCAGGCGSSSGFPGIKRVHRDCRQQGQCSETTGRRTRRGCDHCYFMIVN